MHCSQHLVERQSAEMYNCQFMMLRLLLMFVFEVLGFSIAHLEGQHTFLGSSLWAKTSKLYHFGVIDVRKDA